MSNFEKMTGEVRGKVGSDREGKSLKQFVPIEEIPDPNPGIEETLDEVISNQEDLGVVSEKKMDKKERKNKENMTKKINFQQGEGVAHIGPDFKSQDLEKNKVGDSLLEEEQEENIVTKPERQGNSGIFDSVDHKARTHHDNLKTMPQQKVERYTRGEIREVLHKEPEEEPSFLDFLDEQKN